MPRFAAKVASPALVVVLAVAGALCPGGASAQRASLGPLTAEEGAPLQRLGFTPAVEGADVAGRGVVRADLWLAYANVFEQDSSAAADLYLDLERLIGAATVRYGVSERLEVGVRATVERTGGGFLDGAVTGLHGLLGLGDRSRPAYPRNAYGQRLRDGDGRVLVDIPRRALAVEDVRLFAKWRAAASEDGGRALAVKVAARFPTAANTVGAERADVAALLLGRAAWRGWHVHGLAGGATVRRSPELRAVLRGHEAFFMAGLERPVRDGVSLVAEFTGSTQLLRDIGDHDVDGAPTNVVFGVVGAAGPWRWEVAMQEDVPARGPATDFTVQVGVGRTW